MDKAECDSEGHIVEMLKSRRLTALLRHLNELKEEKEPWAVSTAAANTGNEFRYDLTSGHYLSNLSTKASYVYTNPDGQQVQLGEGKWTLTITLDNGTSRSVDIDIRK